jgi:hypothetical protein
MQRDAAIEAKEQQERQTDGPQTQTAVVLWQARSSRSSSKRCRDAEMQLAAAQKQSELATHQGPCMRKSEQDKTVVTVRLQGPERLETGHTESEGMRQPTRYWRDRAVIDSGWPP